MDCTQEFITKSETILASLNSEYKVCCESIKDCLQKIMDESTIKNISVSGRVKTNKSLAEKIYRKNYYNEYECPEEFISELPDGIGIRVVCLLNEEERQVYEYLKNIFKDKDTINSVEMSTNKDSILFIDFSGQPEKQKNEHDIYRMAGIWRNNGKSIKIEIQIKSMVHYFWGELEHSLFYKNYNYIISNEFYGQLMNSINCELENIDGQMNSLKKHLDRNDANQVKEVKQIAALVLANKYGDKINASLGCKIDLREIYDVLVCIEFPNTSDVQHSFNCLKDYIDRIQKSEFDDSIQGSLFNEKLETNKLTEETKIIVTIIDSLLKQGDIYWKSFYAIFVSIYIKKSDYNYTDTLVDISRKMIKLTSTYKSNIDCFDSDEMVCDFIELVQGSIIETFSKIRKLSFFNLGTVLGRVNTKISDLVRDVQNSMLKLSEDGFTISEEIYSVNKDTISKIIFVNIMHMNGKEIDEETLRNILDVFKKANDYQLYFHDDTVNWLKRYWKLNEIEWDEFESIVWKEDK